MSSPLPHGARVTQEGDEMVVTLSLRAEEVRVTKQVVVAERVAIQKVAHPEVARATATTRRETLDVRARGDVSSQRDQTSVQMDQTMPIERTQAIPRSDRDDGDRPRWANPIDR